MTERVSIDTKRHQEQELFKNFDGIYSTLEKLHPAYERMRFRGAPFMPQPPEDLHREGYEDIAAHMWIATLSARIIVPSLPHVAKTVDHLTLSDMLLIHDIGEIAQGDVSAFLQLNGHGSNRKEIEDQAFQDIISDLPSEVKQKLQTTQERYEREKNNPETTDKEALLTKIIDTVQGNHFVLIHSPNLLEHSDFHKEVNEKKLLPYTKRLEEVLGEENNTQGAFELNCFTRHHLSLYAKKGIIIPYPNS